MNEKGVTLIELILAISLLTIVLITFMAFFTNAFTYNSMTSDKFKGVNYVREKQADLKENTAFKNFFINISDGTVTSSDLSMTNTMYSGLNLMENISTTTRPVKINGGTVAESFYLLKLNLSPYKLHVYVKVERDYPLANNKGLYRLYIETFDKNNKLLSGSYTYYEYK
jgi:hypothetical protein